MNVEGHIQVHSAWFFVRKAVLVLTFGHGLDGFVSVIQSVQRSLNLVIWACDVEVDGVLFGVLRVSWANLETNGQLIVSLQIFKETLLTIRRQQNCVGGSNRHKQEPNRKQFHIEEDQICWTMWLCVFSSYNAVDTRRPYRSTLKTRLPSLR